MLLVTVEGGVIKLLPVDLADPVEAYSSELGGVDEDSVLEEGFRDARRLGARAPPKRRTGRVGKLALIDSLINQLVMARSPPAYTMALQSLAEAAKAIPELKELIG